MDDCEVDVRALVLDCEELVLTRSTFTGGDFGSQPFAIPALDALSIQGPSIVQIVDCAVVGGYGLAGGHEPPQGGFAGDGLLVWGPSRVWIAGPTIRGGDAEGDHEFVDFDSFGTAFRELPQWPDTPFWISLASAHEVLALPLAGQDTAVEHGWTLPSSSVLGLAYHVQALVIGGGARPTPTNSANLLFGY